jgi:hypothetical protein
MKASHWLTGFVLAAVLAALGCFDRDLTDIRPGTTTGVTIKVSQIGVVQVDIVVLVDNSGSMAQEQTALTLRFPELINELVAPGDSDGDTRLDHPPVEDLNIGVIDSDMGTMGFTVSTCSNPDQGDNGCFRNTPSPSVPGCLASYTAFLARNSTNAESYLPSQMAQDFTCIATLGTSGCGFEQQFKAMRQAVTTNTAAGLCNSGFVRPTSLLALIWVTDETDCSADPDHPELFDPARDDLGHLNIRCFLHPDFIEPVSQYVEAFRSLRAPEEQNKIVLGMIVGVPPDAADCIGSGDMLTGCLDLARNPAMEERINPAETSQLIPSCNTLMGLAFPPTRFIQLAQAFGANAFVDSICKDDWAGAIEGITNTLVERLPSTCFPRALTFDTTTCTADCKVIETLADDRDCEADLSGCTSCPPATIDELHNLPPCTDGLGDECEPLKRDLGLVEVTVGTTSTMRRLCLVRQAPRTPDGGGYCNAPATGTAGEGWYYIPSEHSAESCPQVMFGRGETGSLIETGATAELRCLSQLCSADRQCGPTLGVEGTDPTIPCCDPVDYDGDTNLEDSVCDTPPPRDRAGTCIQAP